MRTDNIIYLTDYVSGDHTQRVGIILNELDEIGNTCQTPEDVNQYVHTFPTDASAELTNCRNLIYGLYQNAPTLGQLIYAATLVSQINLEVFYCRERAILAHVILASIGIPSIIVVANDELGRRHAFVKYWHKSVAKILDPEQRFLPTSYNPDAYHGYIYNVNIKELVRPNHILEGYERPQMDINNQ